MEKIRARHLNKFEFTSPKNPMAKFGCNWSSGSEKNKKMWKVYVANEDNDRQRTISDQNSSLEPSVVWAKKRPSNVSHVFYLLLNSYFGFSYFDINVYFKKNICFKD